MQVQCFPVTDPRMEDQHIFMPAFPLQRLLPVFKASRRVAGEANGDSCTKLFNTHQGLTPGLFLFFCCHGVCIGYNLMARHEGPSIVHDVLSTRLDSGMRAWGCCSEEQVWL